MVMIINNKRVVIMLLRFFIFVTVLTEVIVEGNVVFNVQHKFGGVKNASLSDLKEHDMHRHGRSLASIDVPLGGDAKFTAHGLYFTKLAIGSPAKYFHLQVDTGSNIMWVNCAGCADCPKKSRFGFDYAFFDEKASSTSKPITCDQDFCSVVHDGPYDNCTSGKVCDYMTTYFDGSEITGHFVRDNIGLNEVSADLKTSPMDANIAFGCSSKKGGNLATSTDSVDGIIGFGQDNSSMISQLAMANKIDKVFSHCFDGSNGGGIFAIGKVVEPEVKTMTKLVPETPHYTITMLSIDVGGKQFELNEGFLGIGAGMDSVIDSGATLAFLPQQIYKQLINNIMSAHNGIKTYTYEKQFTCFEYKGDISKDFPVVTMLFKDSLTLKVNPTEYLVQIEKNHWCLGWQVSNDDENTILLGDLVLTNKLVTYDLENQAIGITEHDCTKSIKLQDVATGPGYELQGGNIAPPFSSATKQYGLDIAVTFSLILSSMVYHFRF